MRIPDLSSTSVPPTERLISLGESCVERKVTDPIQVEQAPRSGRQSEASQAGRMLNSNLRSQGRSRSQSKASKWKLRRK